MKTCLGWLYINLHGPVYTVPWQVAGDFRQCGGHFFPSLLGFGPRFFCIITHSRLRITRTITQLGQFHGTNSFLSKNQRVTRKIFMSRWVRILQTTTGEFFRSISTWSFDWALKMFPSIFQTSRPSMGPDQDKFENVLLNWWVWRDFLQEWNTKQEILIFLIQVLFRGRNSIIQVCSEFSDENSNSEIKMRSIGEFQLDIFNSTDEFLWEFWLTIASYIVLSDRHRRRI